jgi:WD40 repeat protein
MGVVFKAVQLSLGRLVAIKTVLPGAQAHDLARFQAEAEAIARLNHPHLVAVHEVGNLAQPGQGTAPFLVMEFVGGGTLDDFLDNRPQPPELAAHLTATLADAMQHAHDAGVVHRDLKPSNILLREGEKAPFPKIGDFGLAKSLSRSQDLTISGSVMGTPGYMAPEQARGDTAAIGPAADIHALGAILYRMLTARAPFLGATTYHTIQQVLTEDPVPPRQLVPHIPRDLEVITLKCLEKDPRKRYPSAAALAADLRRFLAGEPVVARPASAYERAVKWVRRNPMLSSLILVSLLAVAGMSVGAWVHQQHLAAALEEVRRSDEESRQALVRLGVQQGMRALDNGHVSLALAWFAGTLAKDTDPRTQRAHRIRYATALRMTPALEWMWTAEGPVHVAAFSADGKRLLAAGDDGSARVFDTATWAPTGAPLHLPSAITHGAFTTGGGVALAGSGGEVAVHTAKGLVLLTAHTGEVRALQPLPGRRILTAGTDGVTRVSDEEDRTKAREWKHAAAVLCSAASADGALIVSGCADGKARLLDTATGAVKAELTHPGKVLATAWRPGGKQFATACSDGGIRLWTAEGKAVYNRLHRAGVVHLAFSPDGSKLASSSDDHSAHVWNVEDGIQMATMSHAGGVNGAAFSGDGKLVLTWGDDGCARVWSADGGDPVTPWLNHVGTVLAGAFHSSGKVLTAGADQAVRLWSPGKSQLAPPVLQEPWHDQDPPPVWEGPDGLSLQRVGGHSAYLRKGEESRATLRHGSSVLCATFLPDGSRVATGSDDNTARVWDTRTGEMVGKAMSHRGPVRLAAFAHDGALLATVCSGPTARVWVVEAGLPLSPAWPLPMPPDAIALEGATLKVTLRGGKVLEFQFEEATDPPEELQDRAALLSGCRAVPMFGVTPLSPEELAAIWARTRR